MRAIATLLAVALLGGCATAPVYTDANRAANVAKMRSAFCEQSLVTAALLTAAAEKGYPSEYVAVAMIEEYPAFAQIDGWFAGVSSHAGRQMERWNWQLTFEMLQGEGVRSLYLNNCKYGEVAE